MTQGETKGHKGDKRPQGETRPSGRRTHHPTKGSKKGDKGETRGDKTLGKADTPSNKGKQEGKGRQGETRPPRRRTHHPTNGNKKVYEGTRGDKGRQNHREGGHTMQQRETRRETRGDKTLGKADTPSTTKADTLRKH